MPTPAPRLPTRSGRLAAVALLALTAATSAAAVTPATTVNMRLARVDARHAIVAFITITSPTGVAMKADVLVLNEGREVAFFPVNAGGSVSFAVPVARETAMWVSSCVKVSGVLQPAGALEEPFQTNDCAVFVDDRPPTRVPVPRPPTRPTPADVGVRLPSLR